MERGKTIVKRRRRRKLDPVRIGLDFRAPKMAKGHMPGRPVMQLCLQFFSKGRHGMPLLTSECVSMAELDGQIALLRRDLRLVRAEAKRRYARHERDEARHFAWQDKRH